MLTPANAHIMLDQKVTVIDLLDGTSQVEDLVRYFSGVKLIPGGSCVLEIMNIIAKNVGR